MRTARKVYALLENESLWQAAARCHEILAAAKIPHAIMGGVAVCLHGHQWNIVDVNMLVRKADSQAIRDSLQRESFAWNADANQFTSHSGVALQFLLADDRAGPDSEVWLPDPGDDRAATEIEGLPVLRPARLIDTKIACGLGNLRRTHKDFADVIELIVHNRLDSSFARHLHKSLRPAYRELVRRSRGEP